MGSTSFFFAADFDNISFSIFIGICWIVGSIQLEFYQIHRNTTLFQVLWKILKQFVMFLFIVFAFFGYYYQIANNSMPVFQYVSSVFVIISVIKIIVFYAFKIYRQSLGGNFRSIVIVGKNEHTTQLHKFLKVNTDYGYRIKQMFDTSFTGYSLAQVKEYVTAHKVDEIFCSVSDVNDKELLELTDFADNNMRTLKFILDKENIRSKQLKYEYYGSTPVTSLRKIPLDDPVNQFAKRSFDILFSGIVIVGVLSWLTPLIGLLIKLESKGPVFFKQSRNGLDYQEFECYKFRSMRPNDRAHIHQVTRGDQRITKMGKLMRKTSIDELPQFFNVFKGDMSVVGPRPHMVSHTHMYAERVDKFMVRHFVKPGITGLAQVSGYRGEVETEEDIIGRVRNDIHYIENWSTMLDLNIIARTVRNIFTGEDKAY
ncbi:exopolysaccharide biosynthesis polyprenyl glycosylphosphotransferase [Nonlabens ponticola]|uniref:Exopolysaccharide biosynthesis polyprenyl glycosylphosphotransferase n=2 Tax=Nonlabens ponticola TaxID=2496866 RepID=A0A3S9N1F8_9FLAO|nr:exopolysaccharide biosynthesis polyprenyl glycosylphosphotransferase [Nonlabens ponticola]